MSGRHRHGARRTTQSGKRTKVKQKQKSDSRRSRESTIRRHDPGAGSITDQPEYYASIVPRPQDRLFAKQAAQIPSTGKWKRMEEERHKERLRAVRGLPETKPRSVTPARSASVRPKSATRSPSVSVGYRGPGDDPPDPNLRQRRSPLQVLPNRRSNSRRNR